MDLGVFMARAMKRKEVSADKNLALQSRARRQFMAAL
jgi:hypothetical protein